jgi:hypothetical protein
LGGERWNQKGKPGFPGNGARLFLFSQPAVGKRVPIPKIFSAGEEGEIHGKF